MDIPTLHLVRCDTPGHSRPEHPLSYDEHTGSVIPRAEPSAYVRAWLAAPAATGLGCDLWGQLTVHEVPHELYWEDRVCVLLVSPCCAALVDAVLTRREVLQRLARDVCPPRRQLPLAVDPVSDVRRADLQHKPVADPVRPSTPTRTVPSQRLTARQHRNWPSTIPLHLVLEAFNTLHAAHHPHDDPTPVLDAFSHLLLASLRLVSRFIRPPTPADVAALTHWLQGRCAPALDLWRYSYTHVYLNARHQAHLSSTDWAARLRALELPGADHAWTTYGRQTARGAPLDAAQELVLYPRLRDFFARRGAGPAGAVAPLFPTWTDLFVALHPWAERRALLQRREAPALVQGQGSDAGPAAGGGQGEEEGSQFEPKWRTSRLCASLFSDRLRDPPRAQC